MRPKLSVIIPSLTGDVPQSVPADPRLEVVVVTGVSPVGKARNEGLLRATGEYIAWIDADDEVTGDWLEVILKSLKDNPDVVSIDAQLVGWTNRGDCVWGAGAGWVSIEKLRRDVYRDIVRPSMLFLYVTKRELWAQNCFDETVRVAEDYLVLPHVLERAKTCVAVPQMLYHYVCNPQSLINTERFGELGTVCPLWQRRLRETPRKYRGASLWGVAVGCYWTCDRAAVHPELLDEAAARDCVRNCRSFVRRHFAALAVEGVFGRELTLRDRVEWMVRFACAALDWWWIQRRRFRRSMNSTRLCAMSK